ncbi:unnamed protein product [Schistosoma curassoni]|uniref:Uncharacterized protein n=1 Tax=Schistosoma curassoni TaxID=6186 RepID=A0A183KBS0_9TREM|nr:unnamed protein product [Schistosoma curassoni]
MSPSFTVRDVTIELSVPAMSSHLDLWPHCNMVDSIRSALNKDLTHRKSITTQLSINCDYHYII